MFVPLRCSVAMSLPLPIFLVKIVERFLELVDRLADDPRHGFDFADTAPDLAPKRDRGFHVAAEIEIERGSEFAHDVGAGLFFETRRALGPQCAQRRAGPEAVEEDG